jgi:hypothetical protein
VLVLKADTTDGSQVVTALCFAPAHEEAQAMVKGDSVSLVGSATIGLYVRGEETRASLSVMTSALLSGRKPKRSRAAKATTGSSGDEFPAEAGNRDNLDCELGQPTLKKAMA